MARTIRCLPYTRGTRDEKSPKYEGIVRTVAMLQASTHRNLDGIGNKLLLMKTVGVMKRWDLTRGKKSIDRFAMSGAEGRYTVEPAFIGMIIVPVSLGCWDPSTDVDWPLSVSPKIAGCFGELVE